MKAAQAVVFPTKIIWPTLLRICHEKFKSFSSEMVRIQSQHQQFTTAIACRKHDFDPKAMIIGQNEISNTIRQSNARDFGLSGMFDQLEVLMRIAEETDLLEREKKIDALKWEWLDENTFFHYFGWKKYLLLY